MWLALGTRSHHGAAAAARTRGQRDRTELLRSFVPHGEIDWGDEWGSDWATTATMQVAGMTA